MKGKVRLAGLGRSQLTGLGSVVMSVALVAVLVAGMVGQEGHPSSKVALSGGAAWFPSPDVGTVALVDGTTVTRVTQVPVASKGDTIEVVQAGSSADVLDHSTGQAVRVDGASLTAATPVALGTPNDGNLAIRSTGEVTWAVERRGTLAQQLDPRTLLPLGPPLAFPGNAAPPVVGADGTLWLVDGPLLRSLRAGKVRTNTALAGVASAQLVMASGHPVVLDATSHRAIEVNPATGGRMHSACFDSADPRALLSGSNSKTALALAVSPTAGTLLISDLRQGGCRDVVLGDPSSQDRYGQAVESGGYVYVPDYQARTVLIVDPRSGKILARPLVDPVGNAHFDLLAYHGFVWFDDTAADTAGVVTLLGATAVSTSRGDQEGIIVTLLGHTPPTKTPPTATPPTKTPPTGAPPGNTPPGNTPPGTTAPTKLTPTFTYSPDPGVVGQDVTFTDTTSAPHTRPQWKACMDANCNTSSMSNLAGPSFRWSNPGQYEVILTVTDPSGAGSSAQQPVTIAPATPPSCSNSTVTVKGGGSPGTIVATVPAGCTRASFDVQGALGGAGGLNGCCIANTGGGAEITITGYAVAAGEQFFLGAGSAGSPATGNQPGQGGKNPSGIPGGGGNGGCGTSAAGGGGGGESVVLLGNSAAGTPLVIAAGGGAGGANGAGGNSGNAGKGGSLSGPGGQPGTATGGGAGGDPAGAGSAGTGGAGSANAVCNLNLYGGGGGGAGYFGGGGGSSGGSGGGGGSDFVDPTIISGVTINDGGFFTTLPDAVTVTWS